MYTALPPSAEREITPFPHDPISEHKNEKKTKQNKYEFGRLLSRTRIFSAFRQTRPVIY